MISSDPVVSSPEPTDSSSPLSSPDKMPLIAKEELKNSDERENDEKQTEVVEETASDEAEENTADEHKRSESKKVDGATEGGENDEENESQPQLHLSVPDLINKDPPQQDPRAKSCDVWVKVSDSRLASTPCSGKMPCRISLGEEVLLGNGAPCSKSSGVSPEELEAHPDLLSFE